VSTQLKPLPRGCPQRRASCCPAGAAAWAKQKAPAGDASAGLGWLSLVSPDQPFLHFLPHADLSVTSGQVLTQKHHLIHVLAGRINALRKKNNCRNMVLQPFSDWKNSYHSCEITALLTASRHEE